MSSISIADPSVPPQRKVLWFSHDFPPHAGPGSRRCVSFVHHLARVGWRSTVITRSPFIRDGAWREGTQLIPGDVLVIRTRSVEPSFLLDPLRRVRRQDSGALSIPTFEFKVGWYPYAYRRGLHNIRHAPSQVMVACVPPISSAVVVNALSRSMGLPYIIDVRSTGPEGDGGGAYAGWRQAMKLGPVARAFGEARAVTAPDQFVASQVADLAPWVSDRVQVLAQDDLDGYPDEPMPAAVQLDGLLSSLIE